MTGKNQGTVRSMDGAQSDTKLKSYAFYLPQFHPIPENDQWWGKGFTEWTNVTKARPQFQGHHQPRLPADLGFYDLRVPEIRHQQAALARNHSIDGFIYYHYWFNGQRVLNRPIDDLLADDSYDFPFALCWANEDWRRNWDAYSGELLLRQQHSVQDNQKHIEWLADVFSDPRYIQVENKPMFLIYRASLIPDIKTMTDNWRTYARRHGLGELYLCGVVSDINEARINPADFGLDAAVEFGVDWRCLAGRNLHGGEQLHRYSYQSTAYRMLDRPAPGYVRHTGVGTGFDNTPRKTDGLVLEGSNPNLYREWLGRAVRQELDRNPTNPMVFVNAWNEWAEGAILEPCQQWGDGFLRAHRSGIDDGLNNNIAGTAFDPTTQPDLCIAIVTSGGPEQLMACLQAALAVTSEVTQAEFVVIDNASSDATAALLQELDGSVRSWRTAHSVSEIEAHSLAASMAHADRVLLISSGHILTSGWIGEAISMLDQPRTAQVWVSTQTDDEPIRFVSVHKHATWGPDHSVHLNVADRLTTAT